MLYVSMVRLLIALACLPAVVELSAQSVVLGLLEEVPGVHAGDPSFRGVRVAFRKERGEWSAFPGDCQDSDCLKRVASEYPVEIRWSIGFDGRNLGQVTGRTPKEFDFYSHVGLQEIASDGAIPTVGKRSPQYAGFAAESLYRPLIANSQPYLKDPDLWKPARLSAELIEVLRQQFRLKFPTVSNCASVRENLPKPWPYQNKDIRVTKAYSSKNHWSLAQLSLDAYRCDGAPDDAFVDQWFAISPERDIRFLDRGMWLVDAGDYDDDGKSELVFSIAEDNRGGYRLFSDDFKKRSVFEFSFH